MGERPRPHYPAMQGPRGEAHQAHVAASKTYQERIHRIVQLHDECELFGRVNDQCPSRFAL